MSHETIDNQLMMNDDQIIINNDRNLFYEINLDNIILTAW